MLHFAKTVDFTKKESLCIGSPRGLQESNINLSGNPFQLLLGTPQLVSQGPNQG
jgi:hypothetical protein